MVTSFILVSISSLVLWLVFTSRIEQMNERIGYLKTELSKLKVEVKGLRARAGEVAKAPEDPPAPVAVPKPMPTPVSKPAPTPIPVPVPTPRPEPVVAPAAALARPPAVIRDKTPPPPGEPVEPPSEIPAAAFEETPSPAMPATPADAAAETRAGPEPAGPLAKLIMGIIQSIVELATGAPVGTVTAAPQRVGAVARLYNSAKASMPKRGMSAAEWEALIGGNWLNKLGVAVFVVGVALLLGYSLRYFGPAGRIATGAATGLVLLGGGLFLEQRERYALFAKPIIGGGWAILYFTAYATYNIDAARVFDRPMLALLLMAPVAAGMIVHSFKYRAQAVTAIAYGLAYVAIAISPVTSFSLVAVGLLAASLLVVLHYVRWYSLAQVAVLGSYVCHYLWTGQRVTEIPGEWFWVSQGMLVVYWVLFMAVTVLHRKPDARDDRMLLTVTVGNTVGFLGFSGWEILAARPDDMAWLVGGALAAYAAVSYLLHARGRTMLFLFNASVGIALAAAALPFAQQAWGLAPEWLSPYWAAEAGLVTAMGFRLRQVVLRIEGYLLVVASLIALFAINLGGPAEGRQILVWVTASPVILFAYYIFAKLKAEAGKEDVWNAAGDLALVFGYAATAAVARLVHMEVPGAYLGLAWLFGGLAYFEFGLANRSPHLRGQGYVLTALAVVAFLYANLLLGADGLPLPLWLVVGPGVAGLYYLFWRMFGASRQKALTNPEGAAADVPAIVASTLLALLLWVELPLPVVGLAWLIAALVLFEAGLLVGRVALRYQGYALTGLAATATFWVDFNGGLLTDFGEWRLVTVTPALGLFYFLFWRMHGAQRRGKLSAAEAGLVDLPSIIASTLLVFLLWREMPRDAHGLSWLVAALVIFEAGLRSGRTTLRYQGYAIAALAGTALFAINLFGVGESGVTLSRWAMILPGIGLFYYMFWRLFGGQSRAKTSPGEVRIADLASGAASALLALLLWMELPPAAIGLAWLVAGLALFETGLKTGWAMLRYQGYVFAALATAALFTVNLYGFYGSAESGILGSRWAMITPAAGLFYYLFWRLGVARRGKVLPVDEANLANLPSWIAAALFIVLLWRELPPVAVALSWGAFGLTLFEIGGKAGYSALRLQGHLLLGATFLRLGQANLAGQGDMASLSQRLITAMPVITMAYYLFWRLRAPGAPGQLAQFEKKYLQTAYMYVGAIALAALAWFELGPVHGVIAWAILMLIFLTLGVLKDNSHFRVQSYFLAGLTFVYCWTTNIYLTGSFYGVAESYASVGPAVAAFLAAALLCIYKRESYVGKEQVLPAEWGWRKFQLGLDGYSQVTFALLGPTLAAALLYHEVQGNMLTIALSLEGFLVLVLGFLVAERTFRLFGLALLVVCVAKLVAIDLQNVDMIYRIFSFIVLGLLLVLVSFVYTKHRDLLRRLL